MSEILAENEVNTDSVENLFRAAFLPVERQSDGDLIVRDESGVRTHIRVELDKKIITFFSIWGLKENVDETEKLRFVNGLNDKLLMVRFCMPRTNILWCDYQFYYVGGLIPYQVIHNYRRFVTICGGAAERDTQGIVE